MGRFYEMKSNQNYPINFCIIIKTQRHLVRNASIFTLPNKYSNKTITPNAPQSKPENPNNPSDSSSKSPPLHQINSHTIVGTWQGADAEKPCKSY